MSLLRVHYYWIAGYLVTGRGGINVRRASVVAAISLPVMPKRPGVGDGDAFR